MKKIAVIGTGIMGNGIAQSYLRNGYQVFVWNRSKDVLKDLLKKGAVAAATPAEAAASADIVFEVTASDDSSEAMWLGSDGILASGTSEKALIANGTFSADWIDRLAKTCAEKGFTFFDMPLTGSRAGAEGGTLTLLVGGNEKKLDELKPDLKAISEKIRYFGPAGSGTRYKLLLNSIFAIHMTALGEMLKIAKAAGLDVQKVGAALVEKPGGSSTTLAWQSYQKAPDPIHFATEWIVKDLTYAKKLAGNLSVPLLEDALRKYEKAVEEGHGKEDWSSVGTKL